MSIIKEDIKNKINQIFDAYYDFKLDVSKNCMLAKCEYHNDYIESLKSEIKDAVILEEINECFTKNKNLDILLSTNICYN